MSIDNFGSRFTVIDQIGGGNYGTLFRVIDGEAASLADRIIATKKLKDAINHPRVLREVSVQRHAQQCTRHVARLLHVVPRDQMRAALVLEYVPFDMRTFLNAFYCDRVTSSAPTWCATTHSNGEISGTPPTHVPLLYVRNLMRGLIEALRCLHARGIAHRDVKPENILIEPLGLDHPLRCVCPPARTSLDTNGSQGGTAECCWVHSARRSRDSRGEGTSASHHTDPTRENWEAASACTSASPQGDAELEPCRGFFDNTVLLHHELSGEELARAVHLLHCAACRESASAEAAEEPAKMAADGTLQAAPLPASAHADGPEEEVQLSGSVAHVKRDNAPLQHEIAEAEEEEARGVEKQHDAVPPLSPDVKLCDFGSARHIGTLRLRSAEEQRDELTPGPTTPVYCAPEMMLLQLYGTAVDMWAVGVILFEMLTGEFFLNVGTLRSFYGDVVVHDDYCVMHRLSMMFRHLGTPSKAEWRSIAHPLYYPDAMLPHLPQISHASLFSCLPPEHDRSVRKAAAEAEAAAFGSRIPPETESNEEGPVTEDGSRCCRHAAPHPPLSSEGNGGDVDGLVGSSSSPSCVQQRDGAEPDLSCFIFHHIGACGMDFLRSLLRYNPEDRLTAEEALRHPFLSTSDPPIPVRLDVGE